MAVLSRRSSFVPAVGGASARDGAVMATSGHSESEGTATWMALRIWLVMAACHLQRECHAAELGSEHRFAPSRRPRADDAVRSRTPAPGSETGGRAHLRGADGVCPAVVVRPAGA